MFEGKSSTSLKSSASIAHSKSWKTVRKEEQSNKNDKTRGSSSSSDFPKPLSTYSQLSQQLQENVDPANLPLAARRALFEKAMYDDNGKVQQEHRIPETCTVAVKAAMFDKSNIKTGQLVATSNSVTYTAQSEQVSQPLRQDTCVVTSTKTAGEASSSSATASISRTNSRYVQEQFLQNDQKDWSGNGISAKTKDERRCEMTALLNRWEKASSSSSCPETVRSDYSNRITDISRPEVMLNVFSDLVNEDPEDLKTSEGKNSENIDRGIESENDPGLDTSSKRFHEPENSVCEKMNQDDDDEANFMIEAAAVCAEIDEMLDEALDQDEEEENEFGTFDTSTSARSLEVLDNKMMDLSSYKTQTSQHKLEAPVSKSVYDNGSEVPLLHTISFYRKQTKQEQWTTPIHTVVKKEQVSSPPSPEKVDASLIVKEKIKVLQEEICAQQMIVNQASQALNLCHSNAEFHGSTEQVEGERLLLIASHKKQAFANEIQKLKTEGALGRKSESHGRGTLIISDVRLPLKQEFVATRVEGKKDNAVHYFLCLIRHNADVISTQMLSTEDGITAGTFSFANHFTIQNLSDDFIVNFEVYALQTQKQVLSHDRKYHIKKEHSKMRLTPKGRKTETKPLTSPAIFSPGEPNAVRTSNFVLVGFLKLKLDNCGHKAYSLEKVPCRSLIQGTVMMKVQLHAEHHIEERGFLTMFQDVSGFGAWHRCWYVLQGNYMAYWKYPDDEKIKEPVGSLDLRHCVTPHVGLVSRDICARPHTFQLVIVRPHEKGDRDTLISRIHKTITSTKHLLSADTKEERILWCTRLNEALNSIRRWDPQALQPTDFCHVK
ncbi:anillin-like [Limulus polyphemus]|uniref:Anillin-like n=1 Tax=Limulus polyphemus TaxID=6850 RepID=A0ABM1S1C5_LIMPO|nr:anillin-like [Limulus polyphemus]